MENAVEKKLTSATVQCLIFGVVFSLLLIGLFCEVLHNWFTTDNKMEAVGVAFIMLLPELICFLCAYVNILIYKRKGCFSLYTIETQYVSDLQKLLENIRMDHVICEFNIDKIVYVRKEDFQIYTDWAFLNK